MISQNNYQHNTLKGLGCTILGNFSTDEMVIELTMISKCFKTTEELKQNTGKPRKGHGWTKLERTEMVWVNLKNVDPPFFKFVSVYIKMLFTQLENHSQLLCGLGFAMKDS